MNFAQRLESLKSLGFQVEQDYLTLDGQKMPVDFIRAIRLPFRDEEWASIYRINGLHNMQDFEPEIQHLLDVAFRHDGEISGMDVRRIAEIMAEWDYNPEESAEVLEEPMVQAYISFKDPPALPDMVQYAKQHWHSLQPIDKIAYAWHLINGYYTTDDKVADRPQALDNPLLSALRTVRQSSFMLYFEDFFGDERRADQKLANRMLEIHRIMPALKAVLDKVSLIAPDPMEGHVLVDVDVGPEAVASDGYGYCFYRTREDTESAYKVWAKFKKDYEGDSSLKLRHSNLGMRKVRVSVAQGFEFLDAGPEPVI